MSISGLDAFDSTLQKTNMWLNDIMEQEGWQHGDRQRAYQALRVILHTIRDRLDVAQAVHLAAQLPMLLRGLYFEGWDPSSVPVRIRDRDEMLQHIRQRFGRIDENVNSEEILKVVLSLLSRKVSEGEIQEVKNSLPAEIRDLWPETMH